MRIGGGVATVRQFLQAWQIDEMHLAIAPVLLGRGEALWRDIDLPALGCELAEHVNTAAVMHGVVRRRRDPGSGSVVAAGGPSLR